MILIGIRVESEQITTFAMIVNIIIIELINLSRNLIFYALIYP